MWGVGRVGGKIVPLVRYIIMVVKCVKFVNIPCILKEPSLKFKLVD